MQHGSVTTDTLVSLLQQLAIDAEYNLTNDLPAILRLKQFLYSFVLAGPRAVGTVGNDGVSDSDATSHSVIFSSIAEQQESIVSLSHSPLRWLLSATSSSGATAGDTTSSATQGAEYSKSRRGKVCGHVFKSGESVYRCRDCGLDPTCVLCATCYRASSHCEEQHDVTMTIHSGAGAGCCDCGDVEAFAPGRLGNCTFHSLPLDAETSPAESLGAREIKEEAEEILGVLVDWMIKVIESSPESMIAPESVQEIVAIGHASALRHQQPATPITTDSIASPTFPNPFAQPLYASSTARGKARASSIDNSSSSGAAQFDATTFSSSAVTVNTDNINSLANAPIPWSVILWNDEKHSFVQVIDQVSRATGCSKVDASAVAQRVDTCGRDIIYISRDPAQLLYVARTIAAIDLAVTVRSSLDTFYEQVVAELITFLSDLCATKVDGEGGVFTEVLAKVMLNRRGVRGMSRFQRLIGVDARMWKGARKGLAELYVTLMGVGQQVKIDLSVHFAQIYSNVAESYLLTDREPDHSIVYFGVQVFTVPSISAFLVAHHQFLTGIIAILYSFFTEQLAERGRHLRLPPDPSIRHIDPESPAFKQKRYFQVFGDLNHLLSSTQVKKLICSSESSLQGFATFLDLFTSMNPSKRAKMYHVEYESDTWVTAFNVTIQLGKICRTFGEAYQFATPYELAVGLSNVLIKMMPPMESSHLVTFGGVGYRVVDFSVAEEPISFHHPLGWLFSEMVKNIEALDAEKLGTIGVSSLSEIVSARVGQDVFLSAMDQPLRVIVLVAQIRAGLWVRNGFGMRAQQLHYKEYSLRENTYDQDVFFLQSSLVILDPSLVFVTILDRFQLQSWLASDDKHPAYDDSQAFAMAEEMLYIFIVLLSDPTNIAGATSRENLKREIIHHLCLGPCAYSDLMRRVSEKFSDDPALDKVLAEVAQFRLPAGTADQGVYSLKPEFFADIDPYFPRYSRNQREEAEKLVQDEMTKKAGSSTSPVIVPTRLNIARGPFVSLSLAFTSDALLEILFSSMQHGRSRGVLFSEALVDEALHLVMLAIVEQPAYFSHFASERILSDRVGETTLVELLVRVEDDDRMKAVRHKARWCLDRLFDYLGSSVSRLRMAEDMASPAQALEAKRLAAKARQEAVMKQFAEAQLSFLNSSENIDDEEEGDGADLDMEGSNSNAAGLRPKRLGGSPGTCIVCQDELESTRPFGSLALIQTSNFIRRTPLPDVDLDEHSYGPAQLISRIYDEVLSTPVNLDDDASSIRPFGIASRSSLSSIGGASVGFPQDTKSGLYASACGHLMHLTCFETYYRSIEVRHHLQPTRCHPETTERNEFVCPLCKSLGNVLLPVTIESEDEESMEMKAVLDSRSFDEWVEHRTIPPRCRPRSGLPQDDSRSSGDAMDTTDDSAAVAQIFAAHLSKVKSFYRRNEFGIDRSPWMMTEEMMKECPAGFLGGEAHMTSKMLQVASALCIESGFRGSASLANDLIGYTISVLEIASRGGKSSGAKTSPSPSPSSFAHRFSAAEAVSDSSIQMLDSFLSILTHLATVRVRDPSAANAAALSNLGGCFASYERSASTEDNPLARLIEIAAVAPPDFQHASAVLFYEHLGRTYLAISNDLLVGEAVERTNEAAISTLDEDSALSQLYIALAQVRNVLPPQPSNHPTRSLSDLGLGKLLYTYTLPFLRQASILQRVAFRTPSTPFPSLSSTSVSSISSLSAAPELLRLLDSLGIEPPRSGSNLDSSFSICFPHHIFDSHVRSAAQQELLHPQSTRLLHPSPYELVGLPSQLDALAAEALVRRCRRCDTVPADPALCLLCGEMVCSQSFCCMDGEDEAHHGECNFHMWTCGGSVGIYFLVKKNSILYLHAEKGTFSTPPYLDAHGEVDIGGRNRNPFPQFLHQARYDEIRKAWLTHGIPTFVARKLESVTDYGGWTTL